MGHLLHQYLRLILTDHPLIQSNSEQVPKVIWQKVTPPCAASHWGNPNVSGRPISSIVVLKLDTPLLRNEQSLHCVLHSMESLYFTK